jgi:hypothetical protein
MSAVFFDPDQMDATANAISTHAAEVDATAREVDGLGTVEVPVSIAGWFAGELADIALAVRMAALVYLLAAMDTITRAESIRTNQSLATAIPAVDAVAPIVAESGFVLGLPGATSYAASSGAAAGFALTGTTSSYVPLQTDHPGGGHVLNDPGAPSPEYVELIRRGILTLPSPNTPLGGYTPSLGGSSSIGDIAGYEGTNRGLHFVPGYTYVGNGEHRGAGMTGPIGTLIPDAGFEDDRS